MKTTPSFFTVLGLIILGLTIPGRAEPSIGEVLARLKKAEEEIARLKNSMNASDASAAQKGSGKAKAAATSKPEPVIPVTGQKGGKADAALKSVELKETDGDVTLKQLTDAFDVPESPAAAAAGVPQQKTRHLQTPKQLIPAVISGMDEHGKFKSGLSVDWAPCNTSGAAGRWGISDTMTTPGCRKTWLLGGDAFW